MFSRFLISSLKCWKENPFRKPLIIRGARQVGKTTLVSMFAKEFRQFIHLNLDRSEEKKLFDDAPSYEFCRDAIFFLKGCDKSVKNTLIFIDEIQNSSQAVAFLRYFYEENPEYAVIAAGSLLETILDTEASFPVGRVEFLLLHPFSFGEYLLATGDLSAFEMMHSDPFPLYAHDKLMSYYRTYSLIGGMPEAVKVYLSTNDLVRTKKVLSNLLTSFKEDSEKYAKTEPKKNLIRHLIDNVFFHPSQRITFSGFGSSNYKSREVSEAFKILEKTMLVRLIYPVTETHLPMIPDRKKSPKLQLLDTGLVNVISGIDKEVLLAGSLSDVYRGMIAEHIVTQEMISRISHPGTEISFWVREKKQSNAEVDLLYQYHHHLIPVEVKSGHTSRMKSLFHFMNQSGEKVAIKVSGEPFSVEDAKVSTGTTFRLINLPYFLVNRIDDILSKYL